MFPLDRNILYWKKGGGLKPQKGLETHKIHVSLLEVTEAVVSDEGEETLGETQVMEFCEYTSRLG